MANLDGSYDALSNLARRLLDALGDSARNPRVLIRGLKTTPALFTRAAEELDAKGLVSRNGGRLVRTPAGKKLIMAKGANNSPNATRVKGPARRESPPSNLPSQLAKLSVAAQRIYAALPSDGSRVSGPKLRSKPDLRSIADDDYMRARKELAKAKLVIVFPGRYSSVARVVEVPEDVADELEGDGLGAPTVVGGVELESDLYEPLRSWLASTLSESSFTFSEVEITASGKKRPRASGRWSRPDVTAVTVTNFLLLPGATVEVSSFEVKRAGDAQRLESVYEAAAHGRWAHRASLVVEKVGDAELDEEVLGEVERFGLGLYAMQKDEGSWIITEVREPDVRQPDPQYLHDLLDYFLDLNPAESPKRRNTYLQALK